MGQALKDTQFAEALHGGGGEHMKINTLQNMR